MTQVPFLSLGCPLRVTRSSYCRCTVTSHWATLRPCGSPRASAWRCHARCGTHPVPQSGHGGADSVAQRSAVRRLSASGMAWRRRPFLVRARALHRHTSATHRRYGTHAPALLRLYETDARLNARVGAAEPGTHLVPADRRDLFFDEAFAAFAAAKARPALLAREALGAIVVQHLPRQHTQVKRTLRACVRACVCE